MRIGDAVLDAGAVAASPTPARWVPARSRDRLADREPQRRSSRWAGRRGPSATWVTEILTDDVHRARVEPHLPARQVTMHLPIEVADYVDFYACEDHASNVGKIFRPDNAALPPNWKHLPIGYHGRSGTVVVSGTDVVRPSGQRKAPSDPAPVFGPSIRLDIEAELGYVVGASHRAGDAVSVDEAADHLFGVVLLNDWRARDIQAWEYVPLGPFLGKSFATSISAWVTPLDALARPGSTCPDGRSRPSCPISRGPAFGLDIHTSRSLSTAPSSPDPSTRMYWSPAQMLAHLTVNGASLRNGDLFGSGTVSGPERTARQPARAHLERHGAAHPRGRLDPRLPRGRRHRDDHRLGPRTGRHADRPRRGLGDGPPHPRPCHVTARHCGHTRSVDDDRGHALVRTVTLHVIEQVGHLSAGVAGRAQESASG